MSSEAAMNVVGQAKLDKQERIIKKHVREIDALTSELASSKNANVELKRLLQEGVEKSRSLADELEKQKDATATALDKLQLKEKFRMELQQTLDAERQKCRDLVNKLQDSSIASLKAKADRQQSLVDTQKHDLERAAENLAGKEKEIAAVQNKLIGALEQRDQARAASETLRIEYEDYIQRAGSALGDLSLAEKKLLDCEVKMALLDGENATLREAAEAVVPIHLRKTLERQREQMEKWETEVNQSRLTIRQADAELSKLEHAHKVLLRKQSTEFIDARLAEIEELTAKVKQIQSDFDEEARTVKSLRGQMHEYEHRCHVAESKMKSSCKISAVKIFRHVTHFWTHRVVAYSIQNWRKNLLRSRLESQVTSMQLELTTLSTRQEAEQQRWNVFERRAKLRQMCDVIQQLFQVAYTGVISTWKKNALDDINKAQQSSWHTQFEVLTSELEESREKLRISVETAQWLTERNKAIEQELYTQQKQHDSALAARDSNVCALQTNLERLEADLVFQKKTGEDVANHNRLIIQELSQKQALIQEQQILLDNSRAKCLNKIEDLNQLELSVEQQLHRREKQLLDSSEEYKKQIACIKKELACTRADLNAKNVENNRLDQQNHDLQQRYTAAFNATKMAAGEQTSLEKHIEELTHELTQQSKLVVDLQRENELLANEAESSSVLPMSIPLFGGK